MIALVFSGPLWGGPITDNLERVAQNLPELFTASTENLGLQSTETLFRYWTEDDVAFFQLRANQYMGNDLPPTGSVPSPGYLVKIKSDAFFGLLGEAFAVSILRKRTQANRSHRVMDDFQYRTLNPRSFKNPDGIAYEATGSQEIIIHGLLESKVGTAASYKQKQAVGFLEFWQQRGIRVYTVRMTDRYYTPQKISIMLNGTKRSIASVTAVELRAATLLITHQASKYFEGTVVHPPFTQTQGRRLIAHYLTLLVEGREIDPAKNLPTPIIRDYAEECFYTMLNDWIVELGTWPNVPQGASGALSRHLARGVEEHHGQTEVFAYHLTPAARETLMASRNMPGIGSMIRFFRRQHNVTEGALVTAKYYLDYYRSDLSYEEGLRELSQLKSTWSTVKPADLPSRCGPQILKAAG